MEIRIDLERLDPPTGRLQLVAGPASASRPADGTERPFAGWLGLLRALYEVVGRPEDHAAGGG